MRVLLMMVFLVVLVLNGCSSNGQEAKKNDGWTITVSGKVGFPIDGKISITELKRNGQGWQDTIVLKSNYTYSKKVTLKEPGYYRLNFYNTQLVDLILDKNNVEINVDGNSNAGFYEVKGSLDIDFIRQVQIMQQAVATSPEGMRLSNEFQMAQKAGDQNKMIELQNQYMDLAAKENVKIAAFIKNAPASLGAINLLQSGKTLDIDQYFDVYAAVADKAIKAWPNSDHVKDFAEMVNKNKAIAIGQVAPEIALPNPDGQIVKLSSLRGKYVLIDFWAKWCGPCRRENPNVVSAYKAYKDKGFTVFGVSLDRSKEDWVKAIREDNLTWTHVSDLKYFQSEAAALYNVNAIPFSVLIDPNGVIIAKNLRGEELHSKLAEIFQKKTGL